MAYRNYSTAVSHIVDTNGQGDFSTIAAALNVAVSGQTIFIRPGTYTENVTLKAGVDLTAFGSDASLNATGKVIISGTCTMTTAGSVTISGIQLQTNSAALLAVTGSVASVVNLRNCYLNCTNNTGITFSSSSASAGINIYYCLGNLGTTGIGFLNHSSAGNVTHFGCDFFNSGGSSTGDTISAGSVGYDYTFARHPVTTSGTSTIGVNYFKVDTSAINAICLTVGGSGSNGSNNCAFTSGTASAISVGSTFLALTTFINSNNTNAITGAGTFTYQNVTFSGTSVKINTTTQVGGLLSGGVTQAPSAGFLGERITNSASGVSVNPSDTAVNVTSITLTPGIWDVTGWVNAASSANVGSAVKAQITTTSATISGTLGINTAQYNAPSVFSNFTISAPIVRAVVTTNTTYFLVGTVDFGSGTGSVSGIISATRVA